MKKTLLKFILSMFCIFSMLEIYADEGGLDFEMAFFKITKEVKSLNNEILSLKEENEILKETQRQNSEKIAKLFEIIELNSTENKKEEVTLKTDIEKNALKLYSNGKSQFVLGDYEKAIELFINYLENFPDLENVADSKLWLGRAYSRSEEYINSKKSYLDFQSSHTNHPKYADSLYELSRVLIELNELNNAKLVLLEMIEGYPDHSLTKKANQLLLEL
jgi:TolA-binding protein